MFALRFVIVAIVVGACSRAAGTAGAGSMLAPALPAGVTPALIARGDSLYHARSCVRCHGPAGAGGQNGPVLSDREWLHHAGAYDEIVRTITTGVPRAALKDQTRRFAMNARGGQPVLDDDEIRAIAAYVWSLSWLNATANR
jgi:mono/diheme cytochrome c family protein